MDWINHTYRGSCSEQMYKSLDADVKGFTATGDYSADVSRRISLFIPALLMGVVLCVMQLVEVILFTVAAPFICLGQAIASKIEENTLFMDEISTFGGVLFRSYIATIALLILPLVQLFNRPPSMAPTDIEFEDPEEV